MNIHMQIRLANLAAALDDSVVLEPGLFADQKGTGSIFDRGTWRWDGLYNGRANFWMFAGVFAIYRGGSINLLAPDGVMTRDGLWYVETWEPGVRERIETVGLRATPFKTRSEA